MADNKNKNFKILDNLDKIIWDYYTSVFSDYW